MPELKFQDLVEATDPKHIGPQLAPFFTNRARLSIEATRRQPPVCNWVTYRHGRDRVVLKSFFAEDEFASYRDKLIRHYPNRVNEPLHPRGGFQFFPDINSVAWKFPFDPMMPSLDRALDGEWIADAIGMPELRELRADLLDYAAENDTIIAYRQPGRPPLAFGKTGPSDNVGLQYLVMNRLWNSEPCRAGDLKLARPLAYRKDMGLLVQSRVPGKPLAGPRNRRGFLDLSRYAGQALATVHSLDIPFGPEKPVERLIRRLESDLPDLALSAPELYPELRKLVGQLQLRADSTMPTPLVPCHGDYKYDQFLCARGEYSLIDFELFCQSEAALDLGTFCAYLPNSTPADWAEGMAAEVCRSAFLHSYEEWTGEPIDYDRLALFEAAMLAVRGLSHVWRGTSAHSQLRASEMLDLAFERLVSPVPRPVDAYG